jgi:hypothetical protein
MRFGLATVPAATGETAKGLVVIVVVAGGEDGATWKSRWMAVVRLCLSLLLSLGGLLLLL